MSTQTAYTPANAGAPAARQGGAAFLVSRILLAALFLIAGVGKLAAPAGTMAYIASAGLPFPTLSYVVAVIVEVGGGVLLVLGYRARLVAAILAVFTVVTALVFHSALGDAGQQVNFLKNLAIAGGLLQVVLHGAGAYSIDRRVR
ncbi:DoxX family protein [Bordetella genomosp. 11]|uniref:LysR family transcriptional regulator n=1 Tax=Bordetella genomosp. 11 TaxID=1416808 RepID=A0A261UYM4_9BORD|nr:DoxX family protein [Bordetella genomosp. 11]OZI66998.1 LysR family transcriptional regulator [Bordetella genomosp. 11]